MNWQYLYLLFDEGNPLHSNDSNYVFTTEGHILSLGRQHLKPISASRRKLRHIDNHQCPVYLPFVQGANLRGHQLDGLVRGIQSRPDFEYARSLVGFAPPQKDIVTWSPSGWCERPHVDLFVSDSLFMTAVHDDHDCVLVLRCCFVDGRENSRGRSKSKLTQIRCTSRWLHCAKCYWYSNPHCSTIRWQWLRYQEMCVIPFTHSFILTHVLVGHYTVRTGHIVYINDSSLLAHLDNKKTDAKHLDVLLRFYAEDVDSLAQKAGLPTTISDDMQVLLVGYTAQFGGTLNIKSQSDPNSSHFAHKGGVNVYRDADNPLGCTPYRYSHPSSVLVVHRGECAFLEKLIYARDASAVGVIVISDDDLIINPTANADELQAAGDLSNTTLVLLPHKAGQTLLEMIGRAEQGIISQVRMVLEDDTADTPPLKDPNRILYINGHPLRNTRLWV